MYASGFPAFAFAWPCARGSFGWRFHAVEGVLPSFASSPPSKSMYRAFENLGAVHASGA